jgi:aryl-alcohol dehydrogenase-like predicted oxidoreductase
MTSHDQRYRLGPVTVSRIGFGAMQLPGPGVFGPPRLAVGHLADRHSLPVLEECEARALPSCRSSPLGSAFAAGNPVLRSPQVASIAARLGRTQAQISPAWLLSFRPNILLIPGTSSVSHLEENMAAGDIELDAAARKALASAG